MNQICSEQTNSNFFNDKEKENIQNSSDMNKGQGGKEKSKKLLNFILSSSMKKIYPNKNDVSVISKIQNNKNMSFYNNSSFTSPIQPTTAINSEIPLKLFSYSQLTRKVNFSKNIEEIKNQNENENYNNDDSTLIGYNNLEIFDCENNISSSGFILNFTNNENKKLKRFDSPPKKSVKTSYKKTKEHQKTPYKSCKSYETSLKNIEQKLDGSKSGNSSKNFMSKSEMWRSVGLEVNDYIEKTPIKNFDGRCDINTGKIWNSEEKLKPKIYERIDFFEVDESFFYEQEDYDVKSK